MGTSVRAAGATVGMDDGAAGPAQSLPRAVRNDYLTGG